MDKYAKSEGSEFLREFVVHPKSIINETKKSYKLKFNKGTVYKFYMSAKPSEFNAKLSLYDPDHNLIKTISNNTEEKYYTMQFHCNESAIYIFELSGMKTEVSKDKNCIQAILTFIGEYETNE